MLCYINSYSYRDPLRSLIVSVKELETNTVNSKQIFKEDKKPSPSCYDSGILNKEFQDIVDDNDSKTTLQKQTVNAGWYGKGYCKRKKYKRR